MKFTVQVARSAAKTLDTLDKPTHRRVWAKIRALADVPRPHGAKALTHGLKGLYRVRVGQYRVVYRVVDAESLVRVTRIGTRSSIYDDAERAE
jgi:mRNA interferase RelE/StbE